jgi:hypothetical protein
MKQIFATVEPKRADTAAATLTAYFFEIDKPEQAAQYAALVEKFKAAGLTPWNSYMPEFASPEKTRFFEFWKMIDKAAGRPEPDASRRPLVSPSGEWSAPVSIELANIFDNQMNSAAPLSARLFDWSEAIVTNKRIKHGYYVTSDELQQARANTCACGYCGAQYQHAEPGQFCGACLESSYLKRDDLHLLRLRRVSDKSTASRPPLSPEERAEVLPLFEKARIEGLTKRGQERRAKQRADVAADYEKTVKTATIKRDAYTWLLDRGVDLSNVIYYSHTDRFAFGWNNHVEGEELEHLRGILSEFPYAFDLNPPKK